MSESGDLLSHKCMKFAIRIVKLYKWLCDEKKESVMSKQLLRSGTSIGANLAEAQAAISKADFTAKDYLDKKQYESILTDSVELGKMLSSITKKLQPNGRQSSTVNNH